MLHGQVSEVCYPFAASSEIRVDGDLSDSAWLSARRITKFTQRELTLGDPATERTEVAIAYDREALYIAVWCYDSEPSKVRAKEFQRDFDYSLDDNFILVFDTYHDKRNGFLFATNPNGARMDAQIFGNGASTNKYWDGVWDVKVRRTGEGWFAEFKIPLFTLKYRTHLSNQDWGVNFERNIRRKREQVRWKGWGRDYNIKQLNQAGLLKGLLNLRDKQFMEVKPYGIGGAQSDGDEKALANGGGDVNYLLSPNYRLNVTVNTDFAQVESDQQQVNITRFPLYFPELRPFFLEGNDYFDMGYGGNRITPFYTRRIGLDENREAVPIIAGARLLGKDNNRTLGIMSIQTAKTDGQESTNYTVGSWRQDLGEQSVIGAMSVNRFVEGNWHTTTGLRGTYRTSKLFGDKNFSLGGTYVQTHTNDTSFDPKAYAYRLYATYFNDKWDAIITTQQSPEPFNPEAGLMRRRNFRESFALFKFKPRPKGKLKWIRQFDLSPGSFTLVQYNDDESLQSFEYSLKFFGFETRSGENIGAEYRRIGEGIRTPFRISDSLQIESGEYWWNEFRFSASSFESRTLSASVFVSTGQFFEGTNNRLKLSSSWRVNKNLRLGAIYDVNNIKMSQGDLVTNLFSSRADFAFNANTFGSLLGQWSSAADQFIFNFRLRWIPVIGTDFYLIVNQIYDRNSNKLELQRSAILGKLIWRFVI